MSARLLTKRQDSVRSSEGFMVAKRKSRSVFCLKVSCERIAVRRFQRFWSFAHRSYNWPILNVR